MTDELKALKQKVKNLEVIRLGLAERDIIIRQQSKRIKELENELRRTQ